MRSWADAKATIGQNSKNLNGLRLIQDFGRHVYPYSVFGYIEGAYFFNIFLNLGRGDEGVPQLDFITINFKR